MYQATARERDFGKDEVYGVRLSDEDHAAGVITEDAIWMGVEIIHDHGGFLVCVIH